MTEVEVAVRKVLEGDEEAFTQLVRQWETKVYNFALRLLGNREDAQDAVQETFLSVFRSLRNLREPKSFPTWLYRIALNHCRARWRTPVVTLSLDDPLLDEDGEDTRLSLESLGARQASDHVEVLDLLKKAFMGISEDHRTAIVLKEYLGLNLEEIANVMDCPLSTAKSRLYHGLRGVQKSLRRIGVKS